MKRHESLAPLSREHHDALILVRLLQRNAPLYKNLPTTLEDKTVYALNMYTDHLRAHFVKEEGMLDKIKNIHPEIDRLAAEIFSEHETLTTAFVALRENESPVEALDSLGSALEAHIRKEERVLFPLIQLHCSEELLKAIEL